MQHVWLIPGQAVAASSLLLLLLHMQMTWSFRHQADMPATTSILSTARSRRAACDGCKTWYWSHVYCLYISDSCHKKLPKNCRYFPILIFRRWHADNTSWKNNTKETIWDSAGHCWMSCWMSIHPRFNVKTIDKRTLQRCRTWFYAVASSNSVGRRE